jgi:hypothetical protein
MRTLAIPRTPVDTAPERETPWRGSLADAFGSPFATGLGQQQERFDRAARAFMEAAAEDEAAIAKKHALAALDTLNALTALVGPRAVESKKSQFRALLAINAAELDAARTLAEIAPFCGVEGHPMQSLDGQSHTTPLIQAALHGAARAVELLIGLGANVNARTYRGETALALAAREGHGRCVQALLPRAQAGQLALNGESALSEAVASGLDAQSFELLAQATAAGEEASMEACRRAAFRCVDVRGVRLAAKIVDERLEALARCLPKEAWEGPLYRRGPGHEKEIRAENLAEEAALSESPETLDWLLRHDLGTAPSLTGAMARLCAPMDRSEGDQNAMFALAERILPRLNLSERLGSGETLPRMAMRLAQEAMDAGDEEWRYADLLAAANPLDPVAKELWERAGPEKLPRLAARVEREILLQEAAKANVDSKRAKNARKAASEQDVPNANEASAKKRRL